MAFALVLKANRGISPLGFPCTTLYAELQKTYTVMQRAHSWTTVTACRTPSRSLAWHPECCLFEL